MHDGYCDQGREVRTSILGACTDGSPRPTNHRRRVECSVFYFHAAVLSTGFFTTCSNILHTPDHMLEFEKQALESGDRDRFRLLTGALCNKAAYLLTWHLSWLERLSCVRTIRNHPKVSLAMISLLVDQSKGSELIDEFIIAATVHDLRRSLTAGILWMRAVE